MNIYTLLTFLTSASCLVVGNFIYYRSKNSRLHIMFAIGYYIAGAYCFLLSGFYLSKTEHEAWIWLKLTALMHFISPISFHGILLLIKKTNAPIKKPYLALIYTPFILLFIQDFVFAELTYGTPQRVDSGWVSA